MTTNGQMDDWDDVIMREDPDEGEVASGDLRNKTVRKRKAKGLTKND